MVSGKSPAPGPVDIYLSDIYTRAMETRARSTPYAVLGMLSLSPMSGYDIRKESETSIGFFWSESYGQIYPALRELETRRLIRRRSVRRRAMPE